VVKTSPEWVTGPEQGTSSGGIATFSLWTGMYKDDILFSVFRTQNTLKKTRIKLYNTLALPTLLHGSETWTIKASDSRRITAAEMKYMRRTVGYTWTDYKTNVQIAKDLKIASILDKLLEYERNWIHVNRMPRNRLPRVMKH